MSIEGIMQIQNFEFEKYEPKAIKYPPDSILLHYKSREENLLNKYHTYTNSRIKIEIVPIDCDKFDAFSFIDFALALNSDALYYYYVKKPIKTISHTKDACAIVFRRSKILENFCDTNFSFKIRIGENFKNIQVFVKNNMMRFDYNEINGNQCITFVKSKIDHYEICSNTNKYKKDSLIFNIAVYFANLKRSCPTCLRSIFINFQSNPTKNKKNNIGETNDLIEMIMSFPGIVKIILQKKLNEGYSFNIDSKWKNRENIYISPIIDENEEYSIYSLVVFFPWAKKIIDNCNFLEMDACFKSLKPYCFSVCNGIYLNESYPMGISICPSEAEILYQIFVDISSEFGILHENWKKKTLLSDMHPSLCSFAQNNCAMHFFCHRHIYEYFGTNSALYFFICKLLKCFSFAEYDEIRLDIINQSKIYYKQRQKMDKVDENFCTKFKALQEMLSSDSTNQTSKWHYSHWGLWVRSSHRVSTCSNHSEGFHAGANKINNSNVHFVKALSNLLKKVINHSNSIQSNHGKSLNAKCKKLREHIISKLSDPYCKVDYFCQSTCTCGKGQFLSALYGTNFVCEHMIFNQCKRYIEQLQIENNIMKEIILLILKIDNTTPHLKYENKISEIKNKIIEEFDIKPGDQLNIENLIKSLIKCFRLKPNDAIQFEVDYNFQKLFIEKTDLLINFSQRNNNNNKNKNSKKTKIQKDENDFWFQDITSDTMKKANKLKYETLSEIETFYPELKEKNLSVQICDFNYRKHFFQRNEKELIFTFPQFKIDCWMDADKTMKSSKFFD